MTLEMFARMVVLAWFHSICADSLNELSSECDVVENCVRMCCGWEPEDGSCEFLQSSEKFLLFKNFTFPEVDMRFGKPCDKMQRVDDGEWFLKVNFRFNSEVQIRNVTIN